VWTVQRFDATSQHDVLHVPQREKQAGQVAGRERSEPQMFVPGTAGQRPWRPTGGAVSWTSVAPAVTAASTSMTGGSVW
jgi:hypothetical protein